METKNIVLLNGKLTNEIGLPKHSEEMFVKAKELKTSMMRLI